MRRYQFARLAAIQIVILSAIFALASCEESALTTATATPIPATVTVAAPPVVTVEITEEFESTIMGNRRTIEVFLPYDYYTRSRAYKVLYVNDGQDMAALHMRSTLEKLYGEGAIEGIIVVAVHTTADRLNEYGTAGIPNSDGLGARADKYTRFLIEEVMAYINRRYRTLTSPGNTAIMGWSLGGLSAFDIAWNHPDLFWTVGVFSGSFWWRTDLLRDSVEARQNSRIAHTIVRESEKREGLRLRLWFEAGTNDETDDRDGNGVIDAIQDTTELMDELRLKGYVEGEDMAYVEVGGGQHNQATWAKVLPDFLKWAFRRNQRGGTTDREAHR